jgi:hypothetical protein
MIFKPFGHNPYHLCSCGSVRKAQSRLHALLDVISHGESINKTLNVGYAPNRIRNPACGDILAIGQINSYLTHWEQIVSGHPSEPVATLREEGDGENEKKNCQEVFHMPAFKHGLIGRSRQFVYHLRRRGGQLKLLPGLGWTLQEA